MPPVCPGSSEGMGTSTAGADAFGLFSRAPGSALLGPQGSGAGLLAFIQQNEGQGCAAQGALMEPPGD